MPTSQSTARGLGYFSVGLGAAQILAPRAVAHLIGIKGGPPVNLRCVRWARARSPPAFGLLTQRWPVLWIWSRVAGDVLDLGLLSLAISDGHNQRQCVAASMATIAAVTAVDFRAAQDTSESPAHQDSDGALHLTKAITIRRPPNEVYRFWRNFHNLPTFMTHLEAVAVLDERRSHWTARGPAGRSVEWDAEIVEERPNELIAWRSLPNSDVDHSGSVRFSLAPGGICGSDLHLPQGYVPTMKRGDILGHEFMGEVVEIGSKVTRRKVGDRVVVPFPIACGACDMRAR